MLSYTVMCGYSAYDWNTIAMSRSRGGTSLTTRSSIRITPSVISSRPASIRSAVDFPQPDGPTRTMNSLSRTSRLKSFTAVIWGVKRFVTCSKVTSAIADHPLTPPNVRPDIIHRPMNVKSRRTGIEIRKLAAAKSPHCVWYWPWKV